MLQMPTGPRSMPRDTTVAGLERCSPGSAGKSERSGEAMAISAGDKIPDVEVKVLNAEGMPVGVQTGEVLGSGRVVLFGLPGAFTPGCSKQHLPGYVQSAEKLAQKGVDKVVCIAMNDAWVMDAWAKEQGVGDKILMLADGNGAFAEAMGLTLDGSGYGLGTRSQ